MDGLGACGRALILPAAGAQKPRRLSQGHSAVRMRPVGGGGLPSPHPGPPQLRQDPESSSKPLPRLRLTWPVRRRGLRPLCVETRSLATTCP